MLHAPPVSDTAVKTAQNETCTETTTPSQLGGTHPGTRGHHPPCRDNHPRQSYGAKDPTGSSEPTSFKPQHTVNHHNPRK